MFLAEYDLSPHKSAHVWLHRHQTDMGSPFRCFEFYKINLGGVELQLHALAALTQGEGATGMYK
jgi:hypothetical protein